MAKVFRKAFRIVGLDGRKCRRVVGKKFMGIFGSILHGFWPFSVASLTEPCSFWYGLTDLSPLHYPWCQRLFMRAFRVWSSLKKSDPRLRSNTCRLVADETKLPVAREKKPLVPRVPLHAIDDK